MRTLIIADNQDITKAGILYLSDRMPDLGLVTEAADKHELLQLLQQHPQAVVILDYTLFDLTSADELLILQERFKQVSWILFSDELSENFIRRILFSSEAFSIVLKDAPSAEIRAALQSALHSERFICQRIHNLLSEKKIVREPKEHPVLTSTEKEILKSIATHRKNIFRKLEVNNVHEATKYALRAGIVDAAEYYI